MESVQDLIAKGAEICGTKRALAARMETTEQTLQAVLRGDRGLTTPQAIALANITQQDPKNVLAQCSIEREKDPVKRGRLAEAFFPRGTLGAAAILVAFGLAGAGDEAPSVPDKVDYLHIVRRLKAQGLAALAALVACIRAYGPPANEPSGRGLCLS